MIKTFGQDGSVVTGNHIQVFQLLAIKHAVKMEAIGLKRRGRSATVIAKEMLGLKRNTPREEVIAKLQELADQAHANAKD